MKHIPNILSIFRILLIPFFVQQMLAGNIMNAALILILSGITDLLDGFLARRNGWVSQLGKVLDPVADKLTQIAVCIMIAAMNPALIPFCGILLAKEAIMLFGGAYLISRGIRLEGAKWCGKLTTTAFYGSMILILLFPGMPQAAVYGLLTLTVFSALATVLFYIPDIVKYFKLSKKGDKKDVLV